MGEAKIRKSNDPYYGKEKRGLIITNPLQIAPDRIQFEHGSSLDPQEVRFALLFWDQLIWPVDAFGDNESEFLEKEKILKILPTKLPAPNLAEAIINCYIDAFEDCEKKEPGKWSLGQCVDEILQRRGALIKGSSCSIDLFRAIPVPRADVPLNEILEFKHKRYDDLVLLRNEIDTFSALVNSSVDQADELAKQLVRIRQASDDAIKVSKEFQFPIVFPTVSAWKNLKGSDVFEGGIKEGLKGGINGVSKAFYSSGDFSTALTEAIAGSLAGAAQPIINMVYKETSWRGLKPRQGPFCYVARFHNEIFR